MPIFKYDPEVKQNVINAVREARGNSRGWDEALMLAKQHGYRGGLPGLRRLLRDAELSNGATPAPKRKPGRPRKVAASAAAAPAIPAPGFETVQAALNAVVKSRIAGVLSKIRAVLDEAEKELTTQ